jgi:hypothetical protein
MDDAKTGRFRRSPWPISPRISIWTTMPPRLSKRQLREQEELSALRTAEDDSDFDGEVHFGVKESTKVHSVQAIMPLGS